MDDVLKQQKLKEAVMKVPVDLTVFMYPIRYQLPQSIELEVRLHSYWAINGGNLGHECRQFL